MRVSSLLVLVAAALLGATLVFHVQSSRRSFRDRGYYASASGRPSFLRTRTSGPAEHRVHVEAETRPPFESVPSGERAFAARMRRSLENLISFSFEGEPLRTVLNFLQEATQINFVFTEAGTGALEELSVSLSVREMPVWDAMELLLIQTDTAWTYRSRALHVGAPDVIYGAIPRVDRTYDLSETVSVRRQADAMKIAGIAASVLAAQSKRIDYSVYEREAVPSVRPAETEPLTVSGTRLFATATPNEHVSIRNLLRLLRAGVESRARVIAPKKLPAPGPDKALSELLSRPLGPIHFEGTSLRDALDYVRLAAELPAVCVVPPVREMPTVTLKGKGFTVREILDIIVPPSCRWFPHRSAVLVTSKWSPAHRARFETRLYEVAGLAPGRPGEKNPEEALLKTLYRAFQPCPAARAACAQRCLWEGYLVVTADAEEHRRLERLLASMRRPTKVAPRASGRPGKASRSTRRVTAGKRILPGKE